VGGDVKESHERHRAQCHGEDHVGEIAEAHVAPVVAEQSKDIERGGAQHDEEGEGREKATQLDRRDRELET